MRSPAIFRVASLLFFSTCVLASVSFGQNTDADRARLLTSQSPVQPPQTVTDSGVDQGYAAASPNDTDLGEQAILKRVETYQPFSLETGVPIYYTSNVALAKNNEMADTIIAPVVGLTYAPRFSQTLYGEFTIRQQFFYYQDFTRFNFASFDAIGGLLYYLPNLNNLTLRANIDYNRLTGTDTFSSFFYNYGLNLSAELPFRLGRAQQLSVGVASNISLYANPSPPQRNDFSLYGGYSVNLSRNFSLNAAASFVVRPYDSGGRTDVNEILSLGANYRIKDFLTISAISTFVADQSNRSQFDYQVFNIGGGITLSWKF